MAQSCFKASAPGSLMLMGEYGVLAAYPAIVASINRFIHVKLTPRDDDILQIYSGPDEFETRIDDIAVVKPFEYVLTTLKLQDLVCGATINIRAEFSSQQGLGSSAAVTVALLSALFQWQHQVYDQATLHASALKVIHAVQGQGSGADIAASIYGGIIEYAINNRLKASIRHFTQLPEIAVVFSGYKTTTTAALKQIQADDAQWIQALGELSSRAVLALRANRIAAFADLMSQAQQIMGKSGLSTPAIDEIVARLTAQGLQGVKISGSGLGDCVIALGKLDKLDGFEVLPVRLSNRGFYID